MQLLLEELLKEAEGPKEASMAPNLRDKIYIERVVSGGWWKMGGFKSLYP